ncbi:UDP-glucose 4-epimerase [Anaerolineae bacterium]|nr:UDP-glucose 4-epimerase [Anaerolineae bacterium]
MKCLVTGATGFVGAHLVRWLIQHECQVAVLIRPTSNLWRLQDIVLQLHIISGNLFEIALSAPAIQRFAPEIVFHLGWSAARTKYRDAPVQIQNLCGSLNLLQTARDAGCLCWIGLGSQAEYGRSESIITEDSPTHPETLYGITKLSTALLAQKMCNLFGVRFAWLRLFAVYGPMDDPDYLIPYVIRVLLDSGKPSLTSGEQQWDYLFVQDAVRAIGQIGMTPTVHGIFNLGSGQAVPVKRIVEHLRERIDSRLQLGFGDKAYDANQTMLLQADVSRLQKAIGWIPQVSLEDGLEQTINWYRDRRKEDRSDESR